MIRFFLCESYVQVVELNTTSARKLLIRFALVMLWWRFSQEKFSAVDVFGTEQQKTKAAAGGGNMKRSRVATDLATDGYKAEKPDIPNPYQERGEGGGWSLNLRLRSLEVRSAKSQSEVFVVVEERCAARGGGGVYFSPPLWPVARRHMNNGASLLHASERQ